MDVEALRLETGEAARDDLEAFTHGVQVIQPLLQAKIAQVVGTKFVTEEAGELLILL